jgi:hypothetical protein
MYSSILLVDAVSSARLATAEVLARHMFGSLLRVQRAISARDASSGPVVQELGLAVPASNTVAEIEPGSCDMVISLSEAAIIPAWTSGVARLHWTSVEPVGPG